LASCADIHACLPAPICSHAAARRCIFLARAAARRCILLTFRAVIYVSHAVARRCIRLARSLLPTAASFWPALLPAAASFWPPAQILMLACVSLPAPICSHAAPRRCIVLTSRAGIHISHAVARRCIRLARSLLPTGASYWPALLPAAASSWPPAQVFMCARRYQSAAKLLPAAVSFWPPAQVFMPTRRHQSAATLLPAGASFWPALLPAAAFFRPPA
jgi:hypothetical protein